MNAGNSFETLARLGYAARGAVYFLVAMLALFSSFGGGEEASETGALSALLGQPFGRILLGLIAVGLIGYALWCLAQALLNADRHKNDPEGFAARAGHLVSGIAYSALALTAVQMALGSGGESGGGSGQQGFVAWLMSLPFGPILAMLAGAALFGSGVAQIWYGMSKKFEERVRIPEGQKALLTPVSMFGIAARGVVFLILGGFLIYAGFTVNPEQAGSLPEALDWVHGLPFGRILYLVVALGLLAFAAYSLVQALYRRVDAPSAGQIKAAVPGI